MPVQLHKRFTDEEVKEILTQYEDGRIDATAVRALLQIKRARFFRILAAFRANPQVFTIHHARTGRKQIDAEVEQSIVQELRKEKRLVEHPELPVDRYNYSAVRDAIASTLGRTVSVPTIITYAKTIDCYRGRPPKRVHDRVVETDYPGQLVQHDSSLHLWSPLANTKWYLIDSIDDFSRMILHWSLIERETSWAHIEAAKALIFQYGMPLRYYVDRHSIFKFVRERDTIHRTAHMRTDEVDPQWKQVLKELGIEVSYALSPQAKGKVERPFRWMQDRVVREALKQQCNTLDSVRGLFTHEVDRYNYHTIHSTTKEVPILRYKRMQEAGKSVFRKFTVPKPFLSADDLFCLRETRMVNAYRKITFDGQELWVPKVPPRHEVELRMVPDRKKGIVKVRMWWNGIMVRELPLLLKDIRSVQF